MARATKRVWFLVLPGTGMLNIAGPWEVFGHANDVLGREVYELELRGTRVPSVATRHGLVVSGLRPLPRTGDRLPDVAIVAARSPRLRLVHPGGLRGGGPSVRWLRRFHARIPTVVSICTGAFVLGAAGVLDGRRATTHWLMLDELRARCPAAQVVDEGTSSRTAACGRRPGSRPGSISTLAMASGTTATLWRWRSPSGWCLPAPLGEPGPVQRGAPAAGEGAAQVARHLHVRARARRRDALRRASRARRRDEPAFAEPLVPAPPGRVPAELVRRLRIDEARRLLEQTPLPLKDVRPGPASATPARCGVCSPPPRRPARRVSPALRERRRRCRVTPAQLGHGRLVRRVRTLKGAYPRFRKPEIPKIRK